MRKIFKIISAFTIFAIFYYFLSVFIHNSGQFVNYYYYSSSSIKESKHKRIFDKKILITNIKITGGIRAEEKISQLEFWLDRAITKKNFGMSGFIFYDITDDNSRTLRISYKDPKKIYTVNYDDLVWFKLENSKFENVITIKGKFYKLGSKATIHFYDSNKKNEIGTAVIEIR